MLKINKYDGYVFSKSTFINRRIISMFLYYDKYVEESKLDYKKSIQCLNIMIDVFVSKQEFELAQAFKVRKFKKMRKYRRNNRKFSFKLLFRFFKSKF